MKDQERLLDRADTDPFKRMLLRSADLDRPAPQVGVRTRAALAGLAAGAVAFGSGPAAVAGTSSLGGLGAAALIKALGVGFVVGIGVMGGVSLSVGEPSQRAEDSAPVAKAPACGEIEARAPSPPRAASVTEAPAMGSASPPVAAFPPVPQAPPRPRATPSSLPQAAPEQLSAELTELDEARRALASGRPSDALHRLEQMERQFTRPSLAQEAAVVRIEALAGSGARAQAVEQARLFLRSHPNSPYAARVRRALGE